jgi:hypothetical protein
MPGRVGNKQNPIVLLIVRQIPPVLILPLHNIKKVSTAKPRVEAGDSPAALIALQTGKWLRRAWTEEWDQELRVEEAAHVEVRKM